MTSSIDQKKAKLEEAQVARKYYNRLAFSSHVLGLLLQVASMVILGVAMATAGAVSAPVSIPIVLMGTGMIAMFFSIFPAERRNEYAKVVDKLSSEISEEEAGASTSPENVNELKNNTGKDITKPKEQSNPKKGRFFGKEDSALTDNQETPLVNTTYSIN
jgi:hypothetical protein